MATMPNPVADVAQFLKAIDLRQQRKLENAKIIADQLFRNREQTAREANYASEAQYRTGELSERTAARLALERHERAMEEGQRAKELETSRAEMLKEIEAGKLRPQTMTDTGGGQQVSAESAGLPTGGAVGVDLSSLGLGRMETVPRAEQVATEEDARFQAAARAHQNSLDAQRADMTSALNKIRMEHPDILKGDPQLDKYLTMEAAGFKPPDKMLEKESFESLGASIAKPAIQKMLSTRDPSEWQRVQPIVKQLSDLGVAARTNLMSQNALVVQGYAGRAKTEYQKLVDAAEAKGVQLTDEDRHRMVDKVVTNPDVGVPESMRNAVAIDMKKGLPAPAAPRKKGILEQAQELDKKLNTPQPTPDVTPQPSTPPPAPPGRVTMQPQKQPISLQGPEDLMKYFQSPMGVNVS